MLLNRKTRASDLESQIAIPDFNKQPILTFAPEVIEQIRYMLARDQKKEPLPTTLAVVSALRREGVTYTAFALAAVLAHDLKARVGLVDLNWHSPSPLYEEGAQTNPGVAGVVSGKAKLDDILSRTGWENLVRFPAGRVLPADRPILARSPELKTFIQELEEHFDHIVLDVPAVLSTSDAVPLASLADGCYMLLRQGVTRDSEARQAIELLGKAPLRGIIFNHVRYASPQWVLRTITGN